jgi:hypothetical protein
MLAKVRLDKKMRGRMYLRNASCKMRHGLLKMLIMIILLFGIGQDLYGQAASWPKKNLTRGKVWITINNAGSLGPLDIPWSYYSLVWYRQQ